MRRSRSISRSPLVIAIGDAVLQVQDYSFKVVKVRRSDVGLAS
jgi:hypothetical protein